MNIQKWLKIHTKELHGKKIAITGSTGGLGKELCSYLVSLGASLILLDRSYERSSAHKDSLCCRFKNADISCITLDLEDISCADTVSKKLNEIGIDYFIHNAGAYSIPRHICTSGFDNVFQINFASPYYIIRKILPMLSERNGKMIVVGSIAHNYSKIDENDVDFLKRKASSKVYGNAKRYLMFSLYELFKNEDKATLSVVHPGITLTNITAHYPKLIFALIKHPMKVIFMKPKTAALSILKGVFDKTDYCEWIGPRIFNIWGLPKKQQLKTCKDSEISKISEISERVFLQCEHTAKGVLERN
ncbi:MAG: SDR family NAD(P)-dependent oxidoreductase [Ruminococcaceae bacterium]|nr:SDR family NAD(P)-dependent oxidoreductase [Oscillospiraceae bacterium]